MDAVEFCKTVNRMCENQVCKECPVYEDERCMVGFGDNSIRSIEETVSKVEQWAKDHPVKTRQSEFLKLFRMRKFITMSFGCALNTLVAITNQKKIATKSVALIANANSGLRR